MFIATQFDVIIRVYRAVASYVTTVNQLYVHLSAYSWLSPWSSASVWQKSGRLYNEVRNESSLELKLLLC